MAPSAEEVIETQFWAGAEAGAKLCPKLTNAEKKMIEKATNAGGNSLAPRRA